MGKTYTCDSCNDQVDEDKRYGFTLSNFATKASSKMDICGPCMQKIVNTTGFTFVPSWKEWPKREK